MLYETLLRPILFQLDAEQAHHLAHRAALLMGPIWPSLSRLFSYPGDDLKVDLAGLSLSNPVGLAAGFDKNGKLVSVLGHLGFGFAEIGSVTARPSPGNPKPRLFRLPQEEALINRLGLNGDGADAIAGRLTAGGFSLPIGLNIAKTNDPAIQGDAAIEDMLYTFGKVRDLPIGYLTINASCPNTKDGIIEETRELAAVFSEMGKENRRQLPIFVKLSPDSSDQLIEDIVACATRHGIRGYVCGNTTVTRNNLHAPAFEIERIGNGGLSGPPLKQLALELCGKVCKIKAADQIIIAVGGISSGQDAYDFIRAGACAVQIYTALVYHGPSLPRRICTELSHLLERDRITLQQAVGSLA